MNRVRVGEMFRSAKPILGMVHALPLPGSPSYGGSMDAVIDRAMADALALEVGGVDGMFVENYGDAPFFPGSVPPETIAALSIVVDHVTRETSIPVGVNVLRNDAASALAIAASTGARLIRVNVHTGTMHTDQGPIVGRAHETMRARASLAPNVAVCADILVKHATAPYGVTYGQAASDTWERGGADVLIVSGPGTGKPIDGDALHYVRGAVPDSVIWIGSGLDAVNAAEQLVIADGAIVGSALEKDGIAGNPVERDRVSRLMDVIARVRQNP